MRIKTANFVCSSAKLSQCPKVILPEYAMIGRSNVGKSSLINMLVNNKKLAKTSSTPGKTQLINHFVINKNWHLVDLPGYGFAKRSKSLRKEWNKMINEYLFKRTNLLCTFVLIDASIPPQKNDLEFVNFLGGSGISISIIFTKIDKTKKKGDYTKEFKTDMLKTWEEFPTLFYTSAKDTTGKEEILSFIEKTNTIFKIT
jgi:GTP-binding protein